MIKSKSKIFTASLLVGGTAIGAGMLALPVATAEGGFWPAIFLYFLCWVFSTCTGLLLLESCLWLPKDSNLVSLSSHLLGRWGKIVSWVLYLFAFYCLTIAYVAGGGGFIDAIFKGTLSAPFCILLFVLIFSPIVYLGTKAVDRFNVILMGGLIISFIAFIFVGIGHVEPIKLERSNFPLAFFALPIIFGSFSYQGVVPSLNSYFHGNSKDLRKAIIFGSSIPFIVYVIWEYLILGIVPAVGPNGLIAAKAQGLTAVTPLKAFVGSEFVYPIGQFFAFFALTTSFLGVTLGLFDFLADGLKMVKTGSKRFFLYGLTYLPPTIIAMINPKIFLRAFGYAGGIGFALLLGLFPVLMVWSGRYRKGLKQNNQLGGGKLILSLLALFVLFELVIELISEIR